MIILKYYVKKLTITLTSRVWVQAVSCVPVLSIYTSSVILPVWANIIVPSEIKGLILQRRKSKPLDSVLLL